MSNYALTHVCPRCGGGVALTKDGNVRPHQDEIVKAACPVRAMTIGEAVDWINAERAKLGLVTREGR